MSTRQALSILQVAIEPYPVVEGGVDLVVKELTEGLVSRGHRVSVLSRARWKGGGSTVDAGRLEGGLVQNYRLWLPTPCSRRNTLRNVVKWLLMQPQLIRELLSIVRKETVDVVHVHTATSMYYYFRVLSWFGGPRYLLTFHRGEVVEFHERGNWCDRFLTRRVVRGAARINAVSRWLADRGSELFALSDGPRVIYNGLRLDDPFIVQPVEIALPARFMVMVGTFDPYKGHEVAFKAWSKVREEDEDLHLVVIGQGDLKERYEAVIREVACSQQIHLVGQLSHDQVFSVISRSIAMVFPSLNEGLGYVLLEAGALGKPVVCSDIAPLNEVVEDEKGGLLFPVGQEDALARQVLRFSENPKLAERLGEELCRTVKQGFSREAMTDGYEALYYEIRGLGS